MSPIKKVSLRTPVPARQRSLVELIDREQRRIAKLARLALKAQRALARARVRYSVLKRLANDEARRAL